MWKTFQEVWFGNGKCELKNVRNSLLVLKCHFCSVPNDLDGMSVIALCFPLICCGVRGQHRCFFSRRARAATRFAATIECLDDRHVTQLIVGVLSLNRAMFRSSKFPITSSIVRKTRSNPAISKSEFVMVPFGFLSDFT